MDDNETVKLDMEENKFGSFPIHVSGCILFSMLTSNNKKENSNSLQWESKII